MPIYEPSVTTIRISSTPVFDPKKQQQDTGLKLFQADVPYHQTANQMPDNDHSASKLETEQTETCWGPFKNREHFLSLHFS